MHTKSWQHFVGGIRDRSGVVKVVYGSQRWRNWRHRAIAVERLKDRGAVGPRLNSLHRSLHIKAMQSFHKRSVLVRFIHVLP